MALINHDHNAQKATEAKDHYTDKVAKTFLERYFKNKTYFRKYYPIALILVGFTIIENIVSAYTGYSYVYNLSSSFTNPKYCIVFTICVLILVEFGKQKVNHLFFKTWNTEGFTNALGALVLVLLFLVVSVWFSWSGAKAVVVENTAPPALINIDSIRSYYDAQIGTTTEEIAFLKVEHQRTQSWTTINKTIPALQDTKTALIDKRDKAIHRAQKRNDQTANTSTSKVQITAKEVQYIAVGFNLVNFIIYYFLGLFLFKSGIDYDVRTDQPNTEPNEQKPPNKEPSPQRQIGFKMPNIAADTTPNTTQPNTPPEQPQKVFKPLSEQRLNTITEHRTEQFAEQKKEQKAKLFIVEDSRTVEHRTKDGTIKHYTRTDVKGFVNKYQKRYDKATTERSKNNNYNRLEYWKAKQLEFEE